LHVVPSSIFQQTSAKINHGGTYQQKDLFISLDAFCLSLGWRNITPEQIKQEDPQVTTDFRVPEIEFVCQQHIP
jgi:hypothetical protein